MMVMMMTKLTFLHVFDFFLDLLAKFWIGGFTFRTRHYEWMNGWMDGFFGLMLIQ